MDRPLMPKATAVWLIENTALTFEQISDFTGLHLLEVQGIADGDVNPGMQGLNPLTAGELTKSEIARCERDPHAKLHMTKKDIPLPASRAKGPRYTPISKRGDKPDAIAWLLRNHPETTDAQICKLIGTTKPTIQAVRDRSHWNASNIRAQHPVALGLCAQKELDAVVDKAQRSRGGSGSETEEAAEVPHYPDGTLSGSFQSETEPEPPLPGQEPLPAPEETPYRSPHADDAEPTEAEARRRAEEMFSSLGSSQESEAAVAEPDGPGVGSPADQALPEPEPGSANEPSDSGDAAPAGNGEPNGEPSESTSKETGQDQGGDAARGGAS
jgi:hypothetical protein